MMAQCAFLPAVTTLEYRLPDAIISHDLDIEPIAACLRGVVVYVAMAPMWGRSPRRRGATLPASLFYSDCDHQTESSGFKRHGRAFAIESTASHYHLSTVIETSPPRQPFGGSSLRLIGMPIQPPFIQPMPDCPGAFPAKPGLATIGSADGAASHLGSALSAPLPTGPRGRSIASCCIISDRRRNAGRQAKPLEACRAYRLKAGNADLSISTRYGTFPR
jgi:hypothetical protein